MHILILASFYPSAIRPHTGIFFQEQAEALHEAGHKVGVIVLPRIRETLYTWKRHLPLPPKVTIEGSEIPVYRMHYGWFPRVFPEMCAFLIRNYGVSAYQKYINTQGVPDVVHAHNVFYAGYLASRIKQLFDVPGVVTEHSSNHISGRIFLPGQHKIIRHTFNHLDKRYAVSEFLAQVLRKYHPNIEVMDNVVDTDFFQKESCPSQPPFVFSAVGSLVAVKRYALLIGAFAKAFKGEPVILKIGGDGPERETLESLVNQLDIGTQVHFLGRLSRDGVRDLFQQSHAVVSSSKIETFGVTLIEAMACGRPVVATRSGGPEGFVTEETGLLVENNNLESLVDGLQVMFNDYGRYDPDVIRAYCEERFSKRAITTQLLNQYNAIRDVRSN